MAIGKATPRDGRDRPAPAWDYPEWKERYDFAVSPYPKKANEKRTSTVTALIERKAMLNLFGGRERYFFSQFHWVDEQNRSRTTSRDDLVKTFLTLLAHWVPVERLSLDLWFLLQEDRVEALQHRPIYQEAKDMLQALDEPNKKLLYLCGGYGIKLDYLADCEEQCRIPPKWRVHDGPYDIATLREQPHVKHPRQEGTITNYPFLVAEDLKANGWPADPEHDALIIEARRVRDRLATEAGLTPHSTANLLAEHATGNGFASNGRKASVPSTPSTVSGSGSIHNNGH